MAGVRQGISVSMEKHHKQGKWWTDDETRSMLECVKEQKIIHHLDGKQRRNNAIFKRLRGRLADLNIDRTIEQIRSKWKMLKATYVRYKRDQGHNGAGSVPPPKFYEEIDELLHGRPLSNCTDKRADGLAEANVECQLDESGFATFTDEGSSNDFIIEPCIMAEYSEQSLHQSDNTGQSVSLGAASVASEAPRVCPRPPVGRQHGGKARSLNKAFDRLVDAINNQTKAFELQCEEKKRLCAEQREWEETFFNSQMQRMHTMLTSAFQTALLSSRMPAGTSMGCGFPAQMQPVVMRGDGRPHSNPSTSNPSTSNSSTFKCESEQFS